MVKKLVPVTALSSNKVEMGREDTSQTASN